MNRFFIAIALFGVLLFQSAQAQEPEPMVVDSLLVPDSLQVLDSLSVSEQDTAKSEDGVDTVITYSASNIDFDVENRTTVLSGDAVINYRDMTLEAGRISVDWDAQTLIASELPDTIFTDSTNVEIDTIRFIGKPHFKQGADDFTGDEIAYNMKSKIGRVKGGRTKYQDGEYYGEQFKRISEDVVTVRGGDFTTCDADTPHYHFSANRLKIEVGHRVIARPVYLYFADVPVLAVPYGIFPMQKDRTSGIIVPVFGESAAQGRFLRNIGYYWAPSQYMDVITTMDYFEQFGVLGRGEYRYAKRYILNGSSGIVFDTQHKGGNKNNRYTIDVNHNHTIDPNTKVAVSGSYTSNRSFIQDVGSVQDQLAQSVRSNATVSKGWDNSPWNASANLNYTQNIRLNTWNATAPAIQFTHKNGKLFPGPKAPHNIRKAAAPKETRPPWYRTFSWGYSTNYRNELNLPRTARETGLFLSPADSTGRFPAPVKIFGADSNEVFEKDGLSHDGSFSATARILKYLNLNPALRWKSSWVRESVNYEASGDTLRRVDEKQFTQRTTFDIGSSVSTKLYGLSNRPFGIGAIFRHQMTPRASFTYRPDFSDKEWGYYRSVGLSNGREYEYDRFQSSEVASNIGGTPKGKSEAIGLTLENLFQMKNGDPEEGNEKKYDLLSWNLDTGVDMKKDSLRWSDLSMSFRTAIPGPIVGPLQGVSLNLRTTHSFYEQAEGRRVNQFFWDRQNANWYEPLELTYVTANVDFAFRAETIGSLFAIGKGSETVVTDTTAPTQPYTALDDITDYRASTPPSPFEKQEGASEFFDMPLDVALSLYRTKNFISNTTTSTMNSRLSVNLTNRWNISTSYVLDLDRKIPLNADVSITRDLHCWEAQLTWSPTGLAPGFYLRIGLRSPQLQDVKIERQRGGSRTRGYR